MKPACRIAVSAAALLAALVSGCSRPTETPARPATTVTVREIALRTVRETLLLTGTVEPAQAARLAAQVEGEVLALAAREGDPVRRGQTLLRIDGSRLAAALAEAEADRSATRAELRDARRVLERDRILFERQGIGRERLETSETAVLRLEAAESRFDARIKGLASQLADVDVKAPFDGYILERNVELGDVVRNGMPLLTVATHSAHVLVPVSEIALVRLSAGREAGLALDAGASKNECAGFISRIRPRVDAATRTADIEVTPRDDACGSRLMPGMLVRVTFVLDERAGVLAVPAEVVTARPGGGRFIFIVDGGVASRRQVTTGLEGGGWVEVTDGVREGEMVVIQGFEKIKDGSPVVPIGGRPPAPTPGAAKAESRGDD